MRSGSPSRTVLGIALTLSVAGAVGYAFPAGASTPPSSSVKVPATPGKKVVATWTGTIPPGTNPTSDCQFGVAEDHHTVKVSVPSGVYSKLTAEFSFVITWKPSSGDPSTSDEILTVVGPKGQEVGSSDGGAPVEQVAANNLPGGTYDAVACGFSNAAPQDYQGQIVVITKANEKSLRAAPARGLRFSASVPADLQRDEAEPLITADQAGRTYTCGPTGFSNAADYAQVSTDGGKQFHLLGEPPRGQQGAGGGGDCSVTTSPVKNATGHYNYAYSGLGPLTGFATATSQDSGHTLLTSPHNGSVPGVDRQWEVFLDRDTVLLSYNRQVPRYVEILKSTNGGLTFGPPVKSTSTPTFPGPLRALPAKYNWTGKANGRVAYFPWTSSNSNGFYVNLAVSTDGGATWKDCLAFKGQRDVSNNFPVADNDRAGNIYVTYTVEGDYHTYLITLRRGKLQSCKGTPSSQPTKNPGFSKPVQVDRGKVRSTVFPWLAAGGARGRVAVTFYGTESDGNPNTGKFKASWDVYVNQSLNALAPNRTFSQVKATTHPFHYDSICLNGLGCDLAVPPGDRSLADFFAITYNPANHRLQVVFNRANKRPGEAEGHVATPMVVTQIAGPGNGGGTVKKLQKPLRQRSKDAKGDALADYSSLAVPPSPTNETSADFLWAKVGPEVNPRTGGRVQNGGFTVRMKVASLSDAALSKEMADASSQSLLWIFRWANGYQDAGASAGYNPGQGFTFGFNQYTLGDRCGSQNKCVVYPGDQAIKGKVDRKHGIITLSVPLKFLHALIGPTGPDQRPSQVKAVPGSRLYDAEAFSVGNPYSPVQSKETQSFLYPLDNTPALDFRVPRAPHCPGFAHSSAYQVVGTPGPDRLKGSTLPDVICGLGGDDIIRALRGDDIVIGGKGDDTIYSGPGADRVSGGLGNDDVYAGSEADRVRGNGGNDHLFGYAGNDVLVGGDGADRLFGVAGRDRLVGGSGGDRVYGGTDGDFERGNGGDDHLYGGAGNDRVSAGSGDDHVYGYNGDDVLTGGGGADHLFGAAGDDTLKGKDGVRRNDALDGGPGTDTCTADTGDSRTSC